MSQSFQLFQPQNRSKVAVVTGGNKGVGYSVVRKLLKKFQGVVYLTARNEEKGLAACEQLKKEGLHSPKFYQLDITDRTQILEFRQHLQKNYGGIDVLINNASVPYKSTNLEEHYCQEEGSNEIENEAEQEPRGTENDEANAPDIAVKSAEAKSSENGPDLHQGDNGDSTQKIEIEIEVVKQEQEGEREEKELSEEEKIAEESRLLSERYKAHMKLSKPPEDFWVPEVDVDPRLELTELTMKTNVVGTLNVIHCLLPLFRSHGRIINMSSSLGVLSTVTNEELKGKLQSAYLPESELMDILKTYIADVKEGNVDEKGWPKNVWVLSKLAVNLLTRILARDHKYDERKDILVISCCPDLSEDLTPLTADQGAETPLYLALLAKGEKKLHGKIFKDKKIMEWE